MRLSLTVLITALALFPCDSMSNTCFASEIVSSGLYSHESETALQKQCSRCGKRIWFGKTCLTCKAKSTRSKLQKTGKTIKEKISEERHACSGCGKSTLSRGRCLSCNTVSISKKSKKFIHEAKETTRRTSRWIGEKARSPEVKRLLEKAKNHRERITKQYLPAISKRIKDPTTRRRITKSIRMAAEVHARYSAFKKDATYKSVKVAGNLKFPTKNGSTSLFDFSRKHLLKSAPELAGTDLINDPAAVITGLISADRDYFLNELKMIKTANGYVSITDKLKSGNAETLLDIINVIDAVDDLSKGDFNPVALGSLASSLNRLNEKIERVH